MSKFEMTPEQVVEWRQKFRGLVGAGIKDDPISQDLIAALGATEAAGR